MEDWVGCFTSIHQTKKSIVWWKLETKVESYNEVAVLN